MDRKTIHVENLAEAHDFSEGRDDGALGSVTGQSYRLPFCGKDEAIGVLAVRRTEVRPFRISRSRCFKPSPTKR